jgi:zinc/manganese transport system substrate-binding protein
MRMKTFLFSLIIAANLFVVPLTYGQIKIVAAYPYIGELSKKIGGDRVEVFVLGKGMEDPHFIVPKPSFIAKLRGADLLILNGGDLEVGFIPVLIQQANNPQIRTSKGFLDLSKLVKLIEVPVNVSRSEGDIHPEGNPHFLLDPHRLPPLARAVKEKLCTLDSANCQLYEKNFSEFNARWNEKLKGWGRQLSSLKGKRVIEYHRLFDYLLRAYDLQPVGTLEPKPGIPPTARHVEDLIVKAKDQKVDFVLQDVYHDNRSARFLAEKIGAKYVLLPHEIDAVPEAKDLFSLFDEIVRRLSQ